MQELIKYFEAIEARLASLEAAEQSLLDKEQTLQAWEERLQILEKAQQEHMAKLQAVGTHVTAMLQMLKQLETKPRVEEPRVEEPKVEEPRVEEPIVEEPKVEEPKVEEPKVEEPKVEEPRVEEPRVEEQKVEEPRVEEPRVEEPIVEEPKVEEPRVEEPKVEEVTPKASIYGKAVTEIRQAISIGDRFLYQRELFEQNAELMQRTLNELDQLNSFSEAMDYINMHFHWNQESNTYQQFIVTLHRRFG